MPEPARTIRFRNVQMIYASEYEDRECLRAAGIDPDRVDEAVVAAVDDLLKGYEAAWESVSDQLDGGRSTAIVAACRVFRILVNAEAKSNGGPDDLFALTEGDRVVELRTSQAGRGTFSKD